MKGDKKKWDLLLNEPNLKGSLKWIGPKKTTVLLFYDKIGCLEWNFGKFKWSMEEGSSIYELHISSSSQIVANEIPSAQPGYTEVRWSFIKWLLFIVENSLTKRTDKKESRPPLIDIAQGGCRKPLEGGNWCRDWNQMSNVPETIGRDHASSILEVCLRQRAWQWIIHIVNTLVSGTNATRPWQLLTWKQGIFSINVIHKLNPFKRYVLWHVRRSFGPYGSQRTTWYSILLRSLRSIYFNTSGVDLLTIVGLNGQTSPTTSIGPQK